MKSSPAFISSLLVVLFLSSLSAGFFTTTYVENQPELEEEPMVAQSHGTHATSPGHVVFGQYISSDNCGHCSKVGGGSDAHHSIKETFPDEYVYVTYMSASYGDTDTARAGNVIGGGDWSEDRLIPDALKAFESTSMASQTLLFPETLEFSPDDFDALFDVLPYLEKIGFKIKKQDNLSIKIDAIPSEMAIGNEREVIREILDNFLKERKKY